MLSFDDPRWEKLDGGYRLPFDPRPAMLRLEARQEVNSAWSELWEDLHHQGDVGEASYAAVPHLVRIYRSAGVIDQNVYTMVAIIELARTQNKNPDIPEWLRRSYFDAIRDLAVIGAGEVLSCEDAETAREILGLIALAKGLRSHAEFLTKYSEEEMLAIKSGELSADV